MVDFNDFGKSLALFLVLFHASVIRAGCFLPNWRHNLKFFDAPQFG
jgi:hypothetical protein